MLLKYIHKVVAIISFFGLNSNFVNGQSEYDSLAFDMGKHLEIGINYNQLNKGFIGGHLAFYGATPLAMVMYHNPTISFGYSPWKKDVLLEFNYRFMAYILSLGAGVGSCQNFNSASLWYVKPEIGLNISYIKVFYSYSYVISSHGSLGFNRGHNIGVQIPILSKKWSSNGRKKSEKIHLGPTKLYP